MIGNGEEGFDDGDYREGDASIAPRECAWTARPSTWPTPRTTPSAPSISRSTSVDHDRGHRQPGPQHSATRCFGPAKTTPLCSPWDVIQIPGRQGALYRHGRPAPDLEARPRLGNDRRFRGIGNREYQGRHRRIGQVRPAQRSGHGRREPVRRRLGSLGRAGDHRHRSHASPWCGRSSARASSSSATSDGRGATVRLQHCLGLAYAGGHLYIADTYNNKVKICDPKNRSVHALVGLAQAG